MISVIIVNNNDPQLREAIVAAQSADEVIVVEDCSEVPPRHLHLAQNVIVNAQPVGLANCWNMAVNMAEGDKIICLRADEILDESFIKYCRENEINSIVHGKVGNSSLAGWWRTTVPAEIKSIKDVEALSTCFTGCFPKWLWKIMPFRGKSDAARHFLVDAIERKHQIISVNIPMFVKLDPNVEINLKEKLYLL